jgi:PIN domain nuclease of toxin-antitoxin system
VPFVLDLDASAYLAYVLDEPGADAIEHVMVNDEAVMSAVNVAEILYRLARVQPIGSEEARLRQIAGASQLPGVFTVEPFGVDDAVMTSTLIPV